MLQYDSNTGRVSTNKYAQRVHEYVDGRKKDDT